MNKYDWFLTGFVAGIACTLIFWCIWSWASGAVRQCREQHGDPADWWKN